MSAGKADHVLTIRPEQPTDHERVFEVNQLAFGRPDEARLVQALRRSPGFIPELRDHHGVEQGDEADQR